MKSSITTCFLLAAGALAAPWGPHGGFGGGGGGFGQHWGGGNGNSGQGGSAGGDSGPGSGPAASGSGSPSSSAVSPASSSASSSVSSTASSSVSATATAPVSTSSSALPVNTVTAGNPSSHVVQVNGQNKLFPLFNPSAAHQNGLQARDDVSYLSGVIVEGNGQPVTAVTAVVTVPKVSWIPGRDDADQYIYYGIQLDADDSTSVLAGGILTTVSKAGNFSHEPFWAYGISNIWFDPDFELSPGDQLYITVAANGSDKGLVHFENYNTGEEYTTAVNYTTPKLTLSSAGFNVFQVSDNHTAEWDTIRFTSAATAVGAEWEDTTDGKVVEMEEGITKSSHLISTVEVDYE